VEELASADDDDDDGVALFVLDDVTATVAVENGCIHMRVDTIKQSILVDDTLVHLTLPIDNP